MHIRIIICTVVGKRRACVQIYMHLALRRLKLFGQAILLPNSSESMSIYTIQHFYVRQNLCSSSRYLSIHYFSKSHFLTKTA